MSLRVLHIIDGLCDGGSERLLWDTVRLSWPDVEHKVVSVLQDFGRFPYASPLREAGVFETGPGLSGGLHRRLPAPLQPWLVRAMDRLKHPLALGRLLAMVRRFQPDLIHGHIFFGFVYGHWLARWTRRPFVYTVPALLSQFEDFGGGWLPPKFALWQDGVDQFFSGASCQELWQLGVRPELVTRLEGGIDLYQTSAVEARKQEHREAVRARLGIDAEAPLVLSVGRLHRSKGYFEALQGWLEMGSVPGLHWLILGEGEERGRLVQLRRELGAKDRIHLLGFDPDPLPYYAAADLYLRTNLLEAENLSSYQAMAMGLPVVGFETGAESELLTKVGHGMLVPRLDSQALGKAVVDLLSDSGLRQDMARRARSYAKENLGLRKLVETYMTTYRELVRKGRT